MGTAVEMRIALESPLCRRYDGYCRLVAIVSRLLCFNFEIGHASTGVSAYFYVWKT